MKRKAPVYVTAILCALAALLLSAGIGSVWISPAQIVSILKHALTGAALPEDIPPTLVSVFLSIRLPRALCSFLVGGMLSVAGSVMQAVLQNPLASCYTLGVSSGASLGAAIVVVAEISVPLLGAFLLPAAGFAFALLTMLFVLTLSARLDRGVSSHTVILLGMVVTLFMSALLTLVTSLNTEHLSRVMMWQMGSFSGRRWYHVLVLTGTAFAGTLALLHYHRELDILTFGDEQSLSVGVRTPRMKRRVLALASLVTGIAVCFTGTIGFVDLIVPHVIRRRIGPAHRHVLPLAFLYGGTFLALADTISRTVLAPREIPVGAVTALCGTPFFLRLYFAGKPGSSAAGRRQA
ncbi:MAG: iron ABC transporter permease [Lachnospiraceae bacterium]|nr:iron ABC transporter permease [Lachnospiraceae bacterium]